MHVYLKSWLFHSCGQVQGEGSDTCEGLCHLVLSGKIYATKRGIAMKVDEWEYLKSNMYAIGAAISVFLQKK